MFDGIRAMEEKHQTEIELADSEYEDHDTAEEGHHEVDSLTVYLATRNIYQITT